MSRATEAAKRAKATAVFERYRTDGRLVEDIERLWRRVLGHDGMR